MRNSGLSRPVDIQSAGSRHLLSPLIHRPLKHRHRRDAEAARGNIRARLILPIRYPRLPIKAGPMLGAAPPSHPFSRSPCCGGSLRHERRPQQTIPPRARAGKKSKGLDINDLRASCEVRGASCRGTIAGKWRFRPYFCRRKQPICPTAGLYEIEINLVIRPRVRARDEKIAGVVSLETPPLLPWSAFWLRTSSVPA